MTPREVLEFVVKHTAHKSIKGISHIAGADSGNLHACMSGKRPLPPSMARRVGGVVGLNCKIEDSRMTVRPFGDMVISLEVDHTELEQLSKVLAALSQATVEWRSYSLATEIDGEGVFAIAIARLSDSYVVTSITWPNRASVLPQAELEKILGGYWPTHVPAENQVTEGNIQWLRLRASMESKSRLDRMFLVPEAPSVKAWAQMLIDLSNFGVHPEDITKLVQKTVQPRAPMAEREVEVGGSESPEEG